MVFRAFSRRKLIASAAFLAGGAALVGFIERQGEPPPAAWVRDKLWGDDLLAYAVWDGVPRAVLVVADDRVAYDLMIPGDWFWPNWPPRPQWQLMGLGYSIAVSGAPATVGHAPCLGIVGERCAQARELFGQINDPAIVAMEVLVGDEWRRFAVAAPGFAVRLDNAASAPAGYRWLDAAGRTVWETTTNAPTKPGARRARRRRTRPRASPIPELPTSQASTTKLPTMPASG
ncbi:MAG: hypothetical protein ACRDJC_12200 [Thermomicrobiales bacterium]